MKAFLGKLATWVRVRLRETSSIGGLAALSGVAVGLGTGTMPTAAAIQVAVGAVIAIALPGHPEASTAVASAVADGLAMLDQNQRLAAAAKLQADLPAAVAAVAAEHNRAASG